MPFVNINGLKIYYEIYGEGETLVFLHHGFGSTKIWENIYPGFLEKGYRVLMYDRRGYGRSETGHDFEEFYMSDRYCSESVDELDKLKETLNIDSFHIIGQCEGGVIGVEFAIKYPDQVKTMVISSTQCYSKVRMEELNRMLFPKTFDELEQEVKKKLINIHGEERAEPFYNLFRQYGGAYGRDVFDLRSRLRYVNCPTLILYPDRSMLFEVEQGIELYRHLKNGELAVLPKCGHNTYEEQPGEYLRIILNFLKRHGF
jgi:pimeloyl-ACP methyl ester carboxylesterase